MNNSKVFYERLGSRHIHKKITRGYERDRQHFMQIGPKSYLETDIQFTI